MVFGFATVELLFFLGISLVLCVIVCSLAMESVVLFVPAFLFLFPSLFTTFPALTPNEAIGLAFIVAVFGYSSSVTGYWYRRQIDFAIAGNVLAVTIPIAVIARIAAFVVPGEGLLLVFGLLLVGLAGVLYRYHPTSERSCLLCGDAVIGMGGTDDQQGAAEPAHYVPRTRVFTPADGASITLSWLDRVIVGVGGGFAGLVGVAIGEVANTFLHVRKRVPIKLATGTSALILYVTIVSVLLTNALIVVAGPRFWGSPAVAVPWRIGVLIGVIVIVGGQIGSFLNSRAADRSIIHALLIVYTVVGLFVIGETLL